MQRAYFNLRRSIMFNSRLVNSILNNTIKHVIMIKPISNIPIDIIPNISRISGIFIKRISNIASHNTTNNRNRCGFTFSMLYFNERQFNANTSSKNTKTKNNLV